MNRRAFAAVVGGAAVAVGVLFVVAPGFADSVSATRTTVMLVGLVAGFYAFRAALSRRDASFESADLPEVESERAYSTPGADFTDRLQTAAVSRRGQGREHVRQRLERAVVSVLTTYRGLTEAEAEDAVANGTWTEDPYAAAFFTRARPPRPLRARIRDVFEGRTAFDRRATHVVSELDDITENT